MSYPDADSQSNQLLALAFSRTLCFSKPYCQKLVLDPPFKVSNLHRKRLGHWNDCLFLLSIVFLFVCLKNPRPSVSRENLLISQCLWVKQKYLSCTPNRLVYNALFQVLLEYGMKKLSTWKKAVFSLFFALTPECLRHHLVWQKSVTSYSCSLPWARVTYPWAVGLMGCVLAKIRTVLMYKKVKANLVLLQCCPLNIFSWKGSKPLSPSSVVCYVTVIDQ